MGDALSPVACDSTLGTRLPFEPHGSGAPLLLLLIFYWLIYDFETTEVLSLSKPSANQHKCRHFSGTKTWEILDTNLLTAILLDNKNYELKKNLLKPPWNSSWSVTIVLAAADFRDHIFCPTLQMGQVNLKEGIIHECHSSEKMRRNGHHTRVRSWSFG